MKAKEEEECGNKVLYSNGHNLLIKDLVKKKKKNKEVQAVKYKECRKNHAAKIGRYAVDGCCEFIAAGEDETTGSALRCAACDCHRNFHRREIIISLSNSSSSTSNSI